MCNFSAVLFAMFAIASDAAPNYMRSGYLRSGVNTAFARRMANNGYPSPYYSNGCLPEVYNDKCNSCMCLDGGEGHPVQTKRCLIDVNPDGTGSNGCVDKAPIGSDCYENFDCLSTRCSSNECKAPDNGDWFH